MSMSSTEHLNVVRKKLMQALGDDKDNYFFHMKQWFRMKLTKEEFDANARAMLPVELVHLHNEFLVAILTKCQLFISPPPSAVAFAPVKIETRTEDQFFDKRPEPQSVQVTVPPPQNPMVSYNTNDRKKAKPKKKAKVVSPVTEQTTFEPVNLQDIAPTANMRDPSAISEANPGYHSRALHLLDTGNLKGRLLLASWDHGLTGFNDTVASLLHHASKSFLKNIVTAVISNRRGYRVREGKFIHSLGTLPPNPWLRNTAAINDWSSESLGLPYGEADGSIRPSWPTVAAAEQNAAHLASCAPATDPPLPPISAFDLFTTLKLEKSVIPCHTVYALNMERISSRLWHPGWAELEQEAIAIKEASVRDFLREQRLATNPIS